MYFCNESTKRFRRRGMREKLTEGKERFGDESRAPPWVSSSAIFIDLTASNIPFLMHRFEDRERQKNWLGFFADERRLQDLVVVSDFNVDIVGGDGLNDAIGEEKLRKERGIWSIYIYI